MPPSGTRGGAKASEIPKPDERNEYIPSFIAKKPFYIDNEIASDSDYLEHQRLQSQNSSDTLASAKWYERGSKTGPAATKYRKGACENCGSLKHKAKDCLQRRRKLGARWTGQDIAADEIVKDVKLGWDAKRDRWNGFEAHTYQEVIDDYNALEGMKKGIGSAGHADEPGDHASAGDDEGVKYDEETDMGRQQSTSTRSLRLREDTAKYLVDLDLESAKYDPKTRSMQDLGAHDAGSLDAEDGFTRSSGDAAEFERAQRYAWETQERGDRDKLHLQANPTEALLARKRKADDDLERKAIQKRTLADRYGSQDAVNKTAVSSNAVVASNEHFVEYDERGRVKGEHAKKETSMYVEDHLVNNHTAVWGSWWRDFAWGYACCHSCMKNSFCTGEQGRKATEEAENFPNGINADSEEEGKEEEKERERPGIVLISPRQAHLHGEAPTDGELVLADRDTSLNTQTSRVTSIRGNTLDGVV